MGNQVSGRAVVPIDLVCPVRRVSLVTVCACELFMHHVAFCESYVAWD
jgi:hypothetical protein